MAADSTLAEQSVTRTAHPWRQPLLLAGGTVLALRVILSAWRAAASYSKDSPLATGAAGTATASSTSSVVVIVSACSRCSNPKSQRTIKASDPPIKASPTGMVTKKILWNGKVPSVTAAPNPSRIQPIASAISRNLGPVHRTTANSGTRVNKGMDVKATKATQHIASAPLPFAR